MIAHSRILLRSQRLASPILPRSRFFSNASASILAKPSSGLKSPHSCQRFKRFYSSYNESLSERAFETGKSVVYMSLVLTGAGLVGGLFYLLGSELFSKTSSQSVYSVILNKVKDHPEVQKVFGTPIKGHTSLGSRQRRQGLNHEVTEEEDGTQSMLMRFYLDGPEKSGLTYAKCVLNRKKNWDIVYIVVDVPGKETTPGEVEHRIVVTDNRQKPLVQKIQEYTGGRVSLQEELDRLKETVDSLKNELTSSFENLKRSCGF